MASGVGRNTQRVGDLGVDAAGGNHAHHAAFGGRKGGHARLVGTGLKFVAAREGSLSDAGEDGARNGIGRRHLVPQ